jgi:hypothetical protein
MAKMTELNRPRRRRAKRAEMGEGETPLAYALRIMRDPDGDHRRRDKMAIAALPYCHARMAEHRIGVKESKAKAAEALQKLSVWDGDLLPQ